jgi:pyruvate/2-oxoglutarate dehydrogenase complex dihydrolipoamide acyltransferase (E2) component
MTKKTYRPKKGHEGTRLILSLSDAPEALDVKDWPYTTESPTEQAALDEHPWITDRPDPSANENPNLDAGEGPANATDGARELADAEGVSFSDVEGTGQGGRITKEDVQKHTASLGKEE